MYYVYENWTVERTPRATIHLAECSYCNHGKGIHPAADDSHGKWHGPFTSAAEAERALGRPDNTVRRCKHCSP